MYVNNFTLTNDMGNELSRKISNQKPTIKKSKPHRTTIPTSHHRNSSSSSIMYAHRNLNQSPQSSQIKCKHFLRFFDGQGWCKTCTINGWSSGLQGLDKLIKKTQRKATNWSDNYLEWIDFNQFEDIKEIGEGAYSVVYEAMWLNGRRCKRGKNDKGRRCSRTEPVKVVLKSIKNSKNMSSYYIKSLKNYYRYSALICPQRIQHYLEFYGVTQNPTSGEYLLVIQHATFGSLRQFIHSSPSTYASLKWSEKLWWLCDIASNLLVIHKSHYIHGNLHTGNILQLGLNERETYSTITDLGLCIPANSTSSIVTCEKSLNGNNLVYGVLPFIAPEALLGNPVSKYSDIYSFGIIMTEIATGKLPFSNIPHDEKLASEICYKGLRPQIPNLFAPKRFKNLVERCCHPDPLERPTAKQLKYILDYWYQCAVGNLRRDSRCMKITNEFLRADEQVRFLFQENEMFEQEEEMKDKTWFTSRLWTFKLNNDSSTELVTSTEIMDNWEIQQSQKSEQKSQNITTEPENNTFNGP